MYPRLWLHKTCPAVHPQYRVCVCVFISVCARVTVNTRGTHKVASCSLRATSFSLSRVNYTVCANISENQFDDIALGLAGAVSFSCLALSPSYLAAPATRRHQHLVFISQKPLQFSGVGEPRANTAADETVRINIFILSGSEPEQVYCCLCFLCCLCRG